MPHNQLSNFPCRTVENITNIRFCSFYNQIYCILFTKRKFTISKLILDIT